MKYYTAFLYDETCADNPLHCTHKFLGELTKKQLDTAANIVDLYFQSYRRLPQVVFDTEQFFGPASNVRVLTAKNFKPTEFFPELRAELGALRSDDYGEYRPHITHGTLKLYRAPFTHYALMSKAGPLRTWPASRDRRW